MSKKVVIVDDDPKAVMQTESVLAGMGYRFFSALDGKKALELVKSEKPGLVVCDLLLPGIHGVELCRIIKEECELPDTKIIAMSAVYNSSSYRLQMDCMADLFIEKPFSNKDLEKMVKQLEE